MRRDEIGGVPDSEMNIIRCYIMHTVDVKQKELEVLSKAKRDRGE